MALTKYTDTLIRGFQTSPNGAVGHHRVALRVNQAIDAFNGLNADTTRSRSEKAPLYKQLQEQHGKAIKADLDKFGNELLARTDAHEAKVAKVLNSVSLADAVQIVAGLKAAGLTAEQFRSAIADSGEIAVAMARVPQALSGLSADVATAAALNHYPDLLAEAAANERDFSAYSSLSNVVDRTIREIGMNVDEQALASRFDEAALAPRPEPKTQAEQNGQAAE
ncbi:MULTISPECIES: hypothetical protein [Aeromonas]|uniref:hypothetical protein n=1 Tax=Aeromonas TaxID=642 RepID=UPI00191D4493|nr:hypothetical protein [Aeromonas dhakensis]MBL0600517.1 hypothetical protein [Aeromonas dhakensis]MDM5056372.1 hypothetical protein [Aeromonas dhakensis]MDM5082514.1 hypothetical protein [Aeromonas dhakensis]